MWRVSTAPLILLAVLANAADLEEQVYDLPEGEYPDDETLLGIVSQAQHVSAKRDFDNGMPGVLRFGKREDIVKKEVPGVFRFGKRSNKKSVPGKHHAKSHVQSVRTRLITLLHIIVPFNIKKSGVLRFGKRSVPGVLRFGKREMPGVLRFGKRSTPGVLRYGKRHDIPGVMRYHLKCDN
ncbi:hypothetical protein ANCCEY_07448 [Ancylostoma ceylanicum]|uniref:Uncharacterized protein n=1 Tax=Ancylostoma ceylanicum TaxID=53326 RepID=A0A0D6LNN9_9BILA|nr:hypothetical protein ANCCEY_07448 [Ancylostoma ceylanicum]